MLTKMVGGVVSVMSPEEESAVRAEWAANSAASPAASAQPHSSEIASASSQRQFALKTFRTYSPTTIPLSFKAEGIAYDGNGCMFVCGKDGVTAKVVKVFLLNNALLFDTSLPIAYNPACIAVAGGTVWVTNYSANSISVLDAIYGTLLTTIDTTACGLNPEGIVCAGKSVWVAFNSSRTIAEFDVATRALVRTIEVGKFPGWMAYKDGFLFITVGGNDEPPRLKKIRVSDWVEIWSSPTGQYPLSVVRSNDGFVWVGAYWGCNVTRIDEETGEVVGTYPLSGTSRGGACDGESVSYTVFPYHAAETFHGITMFNLDGSKVGDFATGQFPRSIATDGLNYVIANSESLFLTKL